MGQKELWHERHDETCGLHGMSTKDTSFCSRLAFALHMETPRAYCLSGSTWLGAPGSDIMLIPQNCVVSFWFARLVLFSITEFLWAPLWNFASYSCRCLILKSLCSLLLLILIFQRLLFVFKGEGMECIWTQHKIKGTIPRLLWAENGNVAELCDRPWGNCFREFPGQHMTRTFLYFLPEGGCETGAPLDLKAGTVL